ncbi:hypothetical protein ABPG74_022571 [Tetrahymena malaccensis]
MKKLLNPYENQNINQNHVMKQHYFITQIQNLLLCIVITALMQFSNHLALYLIYCCPIYFLIIFIQWFLIWKPGYDLTQLFNTINVIMFIICLPIFFGVFFAVFHPTASLNFKNAQKCQLVGQLKKWIEYTEQYSILYINFEYEGKQYLGQACASNFFQASTTSRILPYKFYYKNDQMACGPSDKNRTSPQYHRLLPQYNLNKTDIIRNDRVLKGRSSGRSSSRSISYSTPGTCYNNYKWSQVKIASWLCQDNDFDVEDYMEPQDCYVNFFSNNEAFLNGINRSAMKVQSNFPLIAYQPQAYFPQTDLICLIVFSYYNWILSFNSIFLYTSNCIILMIRKYKKKRVEEELQQNQDTNQIQLQQAKQGQQDLQPNINQIDQPQLNAVMDNQIQCIIQPNKLENPIENLNQDENCLNFSPQMNQIQNYSMLAFSETKQKPNQQNESNALKSLNLRLS